MHRQDARDYQLKLDSTGQGILIKDVQGDQLCPVATELDVLEAMTRRSLAFDLVELIDFETFVKWNQHLFQILRQAAPPGFKQPSVTQLLRADRQAFVRMQELSRDGVKPQADDTRPLDAMIQGLPQDHAVMYYMLPTQPQAKAKPDKPQPKSQEWSSNWQNQSKTNYKASDKVWKKGKTKRGHMYPSGRKLPIALKGCASCLPNGSRLCFAYNIDGCNKAQAGETCERGYHLCATKGCGEKHPHHSCPKK